MTRHAASVEATAESPYLTTVELAALLRKEPATIRQMRHRGTGPRGTRVGREVLYDRDDIDTWMQAKRDADQVGARTAHN